MPRLAWAEKTGRPSYSLSRQDDWNMPMKVNVTLPFDKAVAETVRIIGELIPSEQAKALRYAFFSEREVGEIPQEVQQHRVGLLNAVHRPARPSS